MTQALQFLTHHWNSLLSNRFWPPDYWVTDIGASTQIGVRFFFVVVAAMDAIAAASTLCPSSVPCSRQWRTGVPCKVSVQVPVKGEIFWCWEFSQFVLQSSVLNWQPGFGANCEFTAASSKTFLTSLRRNAVEVCGLCGMFPNWGGVIVGRNGHCESWGWIPIERRRPVMQVLSFLRHLPQ